MNNFKNPTISVNIRKNKYNYVRAIFISLILVFTNDVFASKVDVGKILQSICDNDSSQVLPKYTKKMPPILRLQFKKTKKFFYLVGSIHPIDHRFFLKKNDQLILKKLAEDENMILLFEHSKILLSKKALEEEVKSSKDNVIEKLSALDKFKNLKKEKEKRKCFTQEALLNGGVFAYSSSFYKKFKKRVDKVFAVDPDLPIKAGEKKWKMKKLKDLEQVSCRDVLYTVLYSNISKYMRVKLTDLFENWEVKTFEESIKALFGKQKYFGLEKYDEVTSKENDHESPSKHVLNSLNKIEELFNLESKENALFYYKEKIITKIGGYNYIKLKTISPSYSVIERNQQWAQTIKNSLRDCKENVLAVVGFNHLCGLKDRKKFEKVNDIGKKSFLYYLLKCNNNKCDKKEWSCSNHMFKNEIFKLVNGKWKKFYPAESIFG